MCAFDLITDGAPMHSQVCWQEMPQQHTLNAVAVFYVFILFYCIFNHVAVFQNKAVTAVLFNLLKWA